MRDIMNLDSIAKGMVVEGCDDLMIRMRRASLVRRFGIDVLAYPVEIVDDLELFERVTHG